MNCSQSYDLWQRRLDDEPIATADYAALDEHLARCSECRDLHRTVGLLGGSRLAFGRPVAPAELPARIVRQVLADRRSRRRHRLAVTAAVAASVLIIGLTHLALHLPGMLERPAREDAQTEMSVPPHIRHPSGPFRDGMGASGLDRTVQDAGSALASLTRRTAEETLAGGRMLLPSLAAPPVANPAPLLEGTLTMPADSLRQAGVGLSTGLDPVASSARRAVSLFWEDLPALAATQGPGL